MQLIAFFTIISIAILITSINVNAQWTTYTGFNFYDNPYGYGWNQPYNWSGNTYNRGGFDYGYSGLLGGFPYGNQLSSTWSPQNSYISSVTSYNPFVPLSSPWALDPGFFPPGWGPEGPGAGGIYGPIYGTSSGPGTLSPGTPTPLPPGWKWESAGWEATLIPPWFDYSDTKPAYRPSIYEVLYPEIGQLQPGQIYLGPGQIYSTYEESTD